MANLTEKLGRIYPQTSEMLAEHPSWIPKRTSDDPYRQLLKDLKASDKLSPKRSADIFHEQEVLQKLTLAIFEAVREYLSENYGVKSLEKKIANFQESWNKQYDRYGKAMIVALGELTDEMKFVNHDGFIRKMVLKQKIEELKKREKCQ